MLVKLWHTVFVVTLVWSAGCPLGLIQHLLSPFDNSLLRTYMYIIMIMLAGQSGHPLPIVTDSVQSNMAPITKFSPSRAQLIHRYITAGLRLKLSVSTPM